MQRQPESSVGRSFMAGVMPGLLLGVALMIGIYVVALALKSAGIASCQCQRVVQISSPRLMGINLNGHYPRRYLQRCIYARSSSGCSGAYSFFVAVFYL